MNLRNQATAIVWFRPENYAQLMPMFEDRFGLDLSYDAWLYAAETRRQELLGSGAKVLRVDLDPHEFPSWCKAEGWKLNAEGRKAYTAYIGTKLLHCVVPPFAWH